MSRTFQDRDFLVWEVYSSSGDHGSADEPHLIFHCLTRKDLKPRWTEVGEAATDAQRRIDAASTDDLIALLAESREIL